MGASARGSLARVRAHAPVKAHASVRADCVDGRTRLVELRSEPPLVLRETPKALFLVGGAAGPLGGDHLTMDVTVADGACLTVRSAAATLVQPGSRCSPSRTALRITVGHGASLQWRPEPLVSVCGSDHRVDTVVALAEDAQLSLVDELVLGRCGEPPGRLQVRCRVERAGVPLLAHDLDLGPGAPSWDRASIIGDARAVISTLVVGVAATSSSVVADLGRGSRAAWLPLAPGAALRLAIGPTLMAARNVSRMLG